MPNYASRLAILSVVLTIGLLPADSALAQKRYDTGASDTEIKIGNIMAYSGPASAYGVLGKTEEAYFKKINDEGGINGRKITFISYDDGYSPPKTVEQVRKLVESDEVLLTFGVLGTPPNSAIQKYLNVKKMPQLFVASGATKFGQHADFPWTMGLQPPYQSEARVYAKYILQARPNAKIGVLYQNDDFGKDFLQGLKDGLGARAASMIVLQESYEVSEPVVDARIINLQRSGADVFVSITTPKFAAQSLKKAAEIGWKPLYIQTSVSASIGSVLKPAGLDVSQGIISAAYLKDAFDPAWRNDAGMARFSAFLTKYYPEANRNDASVVYAYNAAQVLVQVLKQAGDDLTRANVMRQAASLRDFAPDALLPGIRINTAANDFYPIEQVQLMRFKGEAWERFGEVIGAELGGRGPPPAGPAVALSSPPAAAPPAAAPAVSVVAQPAPAANPASAPNFGRRVALVMGNATYRFMPSLTNPKNDAVDVESTLKSLGFETVVATDLDRLGMNAAVSRFARLVAGADVAMVYYSGHGMQFNGKNYLLPTDANLESVSDVNRFTLMPVDDVVEMLGSAKGLQLIVLDACRNNPVERDFKNKVASVQGGNRDAAQSRGFSRIDARSGLLVTYATAANDVASDGDGRNSPFTKAFLKNVVTPDLEVRQMLYRVQSDVYAATGSKQLPEISSLYVGPDIRFKSTAR